MFTINNKVRALEHMEMVLMVPGLNIFFDRIEFKNHHLNLDRFNITSVQYHHQSLSECIRGHQSSFDL